MQQQRQMTPFQARFLVIFGVVFIYMIFGVFLKHQVGEWLAAVWYIAGIILLGLMGYNMYQNMGKPPKSKAVKVVDAEIIKRK